MLMYEFGGKRAGIKKPERFHSGSDLAKQI